MWLFIQKSVGDKMFTFAYLTTVFCTACQNDGRNEVALMQSLVSPKLFTIVTQFRDVEVERFNILYCSLGVAHEELTVSDLLIHNRYREIVYLHEDRYLAIDFLDYYTLEIIQ